MRIIIAGLVVAAVAMLPVTLCLLTGHAAPAISAVVYLPTEPAVCFGNAVAWGI